jgi:hypothetical protein
MNDVNLAVVIEDEDQMDDPTTNSAAEYLILSVAHSLRVRRFSPSNDCLGLRDAHTVTRRVLQVPVVPSEIGVHFII